MYLALDIQKRFFLFSLRASEYPAHFQSILAADLGHRIEKKIA